MASQEQLQSEITRYQRQLDGIATEIDSANASADVLKGKISRLNTRLATVSADPLIADLGAQIRADIAQTQAQYDKIQSVTIPRLQASTTDINSRIAGFKQDLNNVVNDNATKTSASGKTAGDAAAGNKTDKTGTDSSKADSATALSKADEEKINSSGKQEQSDTAASKTTKANADDATGSASNKKEVVPTKKLETPKPIRNPLHSYATSTYGITLSVLSKDSYKDLVNGKMQGAWQPTYSLISSGGGEHANRAPSFHDDFYFDNLKMTTIIGPSANSRGTNAISISFTIIEPYGITLLDRIMDVCADPKINGKNYLQQPYMLEINFFGSEDLGKMHTKIPELQKRIPIKLVEMKIKAGTKGAEYSITAVPFNHGSFMESTNSAPANFEIKATTVGDFFDSITTDELTAQVTTKNQQRDDFKDITDKINEAEASGAMDRVNELTKQYNELKKSINTPYSVTSYAGAWNAWQQKAADGKHVSIPNQIRFEIDPAIKNSPIVDPTKTRFASTDMPPVDNKSSQQDKNAAVSSKTPATGFDPKKMIFNITSGSSITDTINMVMRNSDYIKQQVVDPLSDKNTMPLDKEVDYYKIVPKVELLDFDNKRNDYAKVTTFIVKKYSYYNTKSPSLPVAKPPGAVKQYDYMYTGKNIDILDFSLDFDTAYYTSVIVNREKTEAISGALAASDGEAKSDEVKRAPAGAGSITPSVTHPISGDATATSTSSESAKSVLVANAMKTVLSGSRGDMLNVKLKILGDPHFIKQDDLYANPMQPGYDETKTMINPGSINMDRGEIFCLINFKSPVDMDDKTGLVRNDPRYSNAGFSGYYRILTVESELSRGQFVQTLDCIRVFDVPKAVVSPDRKQSDQSKTATDSQSPGTREASTTEEDEDPFEAMRKQNEEQPDEPINVDELFDTPDSEAGQEDDSDPEETSAINWGDTLAGDLEDAEEVDVDVQVAEDNSSTEPENPLA